MFGDGGGQVVKMFLDGAPAYPQVAFDLADRPALGIVDLVQGLDLFVGQHRRLLEFQAPAAATPQGCCLQDQAGVRSVVALMAVALSEYQQGALLERWRRVILLLDGDAAGQRAATAIAARLRPHCSLQVIRLEAEVQPDRLSSAPIQQILRPHLSSPACHDAPARGRVC